jgi:hypothetical protein
VPMLDRAILRMIIINKAVPNRDQDIILIALFKIVEFDILNPWPNRKVKSFGIFLITKPSSKINSNRTDGR